MRGAVSEKGKAPAEPQAANEDLSDEEDDAALECFGYLQDSIVGIQYYEGEVNRNEMVSLIREPENPYDGFAIRVDNVRGVKVGHLPRVLVCYLAPLVDQGLLHLEGIVPHGTQNKYKMPVQLWAFGRPEDRARVEQRLQRAGYVLSHPSQPAAGGSGSGRGRGGASASSASPAKLSQKQLENSIDRLFDELVAGSGPRLRLTPGPEVLTPLYPHQQEALAWMCLRENGSGLPPFWEPRVAASGGQLSYVSQLTNFISAARPEPMRGGILADDMGLGKTLEVIALICTNCPGVQQLDYFTGDDGPAAAGGSGAARQQQQAHGGQQPSEGTPGEEGERPKKRQRKGKEKVGEAVPAARPKEKKLTKLEKEAVDRAEAVAAAPSLPAAGGPRATLVVCPLSVMSNWQMQLEEHTAGNLKVCLYHGPDRDRRVNFLAPHDVVLTTYQTLAAEAGLKNGLCRVEWLRVVMDEAHTIKNVKTVMAKAAHSLKAARRWAVSGTPIQNSLQDLHGICRFLHLDTLDDRSLFLRTIERPIKQRDPLGLKRLQVLMGSIAMRRTKDQQVNSRPLVALPAKHIHHVRVQLDAVTRAKYDRWQAAGRLIVERHLEDGTLLANYTAVLEILLRLRQICCAASLAPGEDPAFLANQAQPAQQLTPEVAAQLIELLRAGLDDECPVCLNEMETPVITLCRHIFCKRCITMVISRDKPCCPLCRGPISEQGLVEMPPEEQVDATTQAGGASGSGGPAAAATGSHGSHVSAKVAALLEHLRQDAAASAAAAAAGAGARPIKSVVFSQFTSFLDMVEPALAAEGIRTARLDGKVAAKKRGDVLRAFASGAAGSPTVLLCSLKAGGVGLNLVAASRVHLLDPWWNPSVEEQAMDRVHRLGQRASEVLVFRYSAEDSIEERMLELQEQKRDLMKVAFDRRKAEEVRQMRIDDVRMLMQL